MRDVRRDNTLERESEIKHHFLFYPKTTIKQGTWNFGQFIECCAKLYGLGGIIWKSIDSRSSCIMKLPLTLKH